MILFNKFGQNLMAMLPIYKISIFRNELILQVPITHLYKIIYFLKKHTYAQYKVLIDICGVDYIERSPRFEVIYNLLSIRYNSRITIKTGLSEIMPVESISDIFMNANWWEREVWDMFGIFFLNHPDLRRILTDYGFEGFPLRKDFPLTGFVETRYYEQVKRIVYEPLELSQNYHVYNFENPWTKF